MLIPQERTHANHKSRENARSVLLKVRQHKTGCACIGRPARRRDRRDQRHEGQIGIQPSSSFGGRLHMKHQVSQRDVATSIHSGVVMILCVPTFRRYGRPWSRKPPQPTVSHEPLGFSRRPGMLPSGGECTRHRSSALDPQPSVRPPL